MEATGIVQKIDSLGRIHLSKVLRNKIAVKKSHQVELFTEGDSIIIRKYIDVCARCSNAQPDLLIPIGKFVLCKSCIKEIQEIQLPS